MFDKYNLAIGCYKDRVTTLVNMMSGKFVASEDWPGFINSTFKHYHYDRNFTLSVNVISKSEIVAYYDNEDSLEMIFNLKEVKSNIFVIESIPNNSKGIYSKKQVEQLEGINIGGYSNYLLKEENIKSYFVNKEYGSVELLITELEHYFSEMRWFTCYRFIIKNEIEAHNRIVLYFNCDDSDVFFFHLEVKENFLKIRFVVIEDVGRENTYCPTCNSIMTEGYYCSMVGPIGCTNICRNVDVPLLEWWPTQNDEDNDGYSLYFTTTFDTDYEKELHGTHNL